VESELRRLRVLCTDAASEDPAVSADGRGLTWHGSGASLS
jgi:hypothetical protein